LRLYGLQPLRMGLNAMLRLKNSAPHLQRQQLRQHASMDAPTVPGLWMCNYGDLSVATVNQPDIDTFDPAYNTGGRWYGPIPEDKP
jgi:hypothetical protein